MKNRNYLLATLKETNNNKHVIRIWNITKNIEITGYLENDSLSINKNLRSGNNSITPNNVSLNFYVNDINIIEKDNLIKITDVFLQTEIDLFIGKVYEIKENLDNLANKIISVSIKDETVNGYETKFYEDTTYINKYYYKGTDKQNSILYILAKKLGFEDNKIDIEEITYSSGEYITNAVVKINKGATVMQVLGELVSSICGEIYVKSNGTLKITSLLNQSDTNIIDYTLSIKNKNILKYIEIKETTPKEDMVVIDYTEYRNLERQPIFILMGQNGDNARDLANINLRPNTPKGNTYWKISYITENVSNIDRNNIEIKAYYFESETNKRYFNFTDYELDFDKNTLRLWNSRNKEVFIEKFKIYGVPIKELKDNTVKYSEIRKDNELDYNILNIKNKYINDNRLAMEIAKYKYFSNCRKVNTYKLVCNSIPFIELQDVIYLDYKGNKKKVQVIGINQKHNETELELIDYVIFRENNISVKSYKTNNFDSESVISGNVKYGDIELDPEAPPIATNLMAVSDLLAVSLKWTPPLNYNEIKGYYLYITNNANSIESKIFVGNVDNYYAKLPLGEYNFRLKTVNLKGIESDFTPYVRAKTLQIGASEILLDNILDKTSNNKLTIKENSITANKIGASAIQTHHIQSNSIRAEHIISDSITVDKLKFNENLGMEKINIGTEIEPEYKLRLNGNIQFANDVHLKGKITGNDLVVLQDELLGENSKKVELSKSGLDLYEYDTDSNIWSKTLGIRKMKSGVFKYNDQTKNEWLDVRDYPNQVWNNIDIKASLQSFNVRNNTRRVFTEITRHPNDKHLFKIKVGGVATTPIKEEQRQETFNVPNKEQVNTDSDIVLYENIFRGYNKIKVELPDKLDIKYVYWHDGKASYDYKIEKHKSLKIYPNISYRRIGTQEWVEETQYNELYIDTISSDLDKYEIRLQIKSERLFFNYIIGMRVLSGEIYNENLKNKTPQQLYEETNDNNLKTLFAYQYREENDYTHRYRFPNQSYNFNRDSYLNFRYKVGEITPITRNINVEDYIFELDKDLYAITSEKGALYKQTSTVGSGENQRDEFRNYSLSGTFIFFKEAIEIKPNTYANYIKVKKIYNGTNEYQQWVLMEGENPIPYLFYGIRDIPLLDRSWWRKDWSGSGVSYSDRNITIQLSQEKIADIEGGTAIWTATEY